MPILRTLAGAVHRLLKLPLLPLWLLLRPLTRPKGSWVHVRLHPRIEEIPDPRASWLTRWVPALARRTPTTLSWLISLEEVLSNDRRIEGVLLEVPTLHAGWAKIDSLRRWIERLRNARKKVTVYLPQGGSHRELYLASAADRILLAPAAPLSLLGLSASSHYYKGALTRAGIVYERFAHGAYKTANENLSEEAMSAAQREQLEALLGTWHTALFEALMRGRSLDPSQVDDLFEEAFFQNEQAIEAGLVDALVLEDEVPVALGLGKRQPIAASRYHAWATAVFWAPLRPAPYVAFVDINGPIRESGPRFSRLRAVADLRTAARDRHARAIVVLINSPGGSPLISDVLHREILRARGKKPVIALLSDVAASGGYYIAAAADTIVASPLSITGSIGVVGGLPKVDGLLERLGVRTEILRTGPHADLHAIGQPISEGQRELFERQLDAYYRRFLEVVAQGRGKTVEEIDALGQGRIWAGDAARDRGLVDHLGGLRVALDEARHRTGLAVAEAKRLKPRRVHASRLDLPPLSQRAVVELAWKRWVEGNCTQLEAITLLAWGPEPLYYAAGLPTIR